MILFLFLSLAASQLTNKQYLKRFGNPPPFQIDDTEQVRQVEGLAAAPEVFGFSIEKGLEKFPPYKYPKCSHKQKTRKGFIHIDYKTNLLTLSCSSYKKPFVVYGPDKVAKINTKKESLTFNTLKKWKGKPIKVGKHIEFAVGKCNNIGGKTLDVAFLQPRHNKTVERMANKIHKKLSPGKKPMVLVMLTPDSFSRRHFFRKLPVTVEYLNELNREGKYTAFDLKLHNIIGADTSENQMRVFGKKWVKTFEGDQLIDFHGEDAIWNKLRELGFISVYGTDSCDFRAAFSLGRAIKVDHVVNAFYCAFYLYGKYKVSKFNLSTQRCLTNRMSHFYLMNYSLKAIENYKNSNLWIYNHFTAAHEATGQHAATLDENLVRYLKYLIEVVGQEREVVILLGGDHGMRYGDFMTEEESIQENRLPSQFFIARTKFLKSVKYSFNNLQTNTLRLTTKPDLRETMLDLARIHHSLPLNKTDSRFYSLVSEAVPKNRTCQDADIPMWFCSTYLPRKLPRKVYDPAEEEYPLITAQEKELERAVKFLVDEVLYEINEEVYTTKHTAPGLCKKVTLKRLEHVNYNQITDSTYIFKFIFEAEQKEYSLFDSWVVLSEKPLNSEAEKMNMVNSKPIFFMNHKLYHSILSIRRIDAYKGECEQLSRDSGINPEHCFCNEEKLSNNET
mmetsp:Transcript_1069/g.1689  ORF Transcript_1069/g.1689 Transcript_1069/m.1689 type:complete len:674 (-) Transcript_1069:19-2040(-)